jgi:polysaccharide export outer membrane protein
VFIRLLLVALFCSSSAVSAQTSNHVTPAGSGVALAPGDVVRIAVWRNPELSGDFVVAPDGRLVHPLYREIALTGVPLTELEGRVREFLKRYDANPTFVLMPLLRVFVGGEVRNPAGYSVPPGTTAAQAVMMAGGPSDRANLADVRLVRDGKVRRLTGTITDPETLNLDVKSGDQIVIGRERAILREYIGPISSFVAALATIINLANK